MSDLPQKNRSALWVSIAAEFEADAKLSRSIHNQSSPHPHSLSILLSET